MGDNDTSKWATGAILYQYDQANDNKFHLVKFFSRKRLDAEKSRYVGCCVLELHGIVAACESWRYMLSECTEPYTIITDSRAVEMLYNRFVKMGIPSEVPKINTFFDNLMNYVSLGLLDYIIVFFLYLDDY